MVSEMEKKKTLAFWSSSLAFRREWIVRARVRVKWYVVTYLYCTYKFKDKV